ncbi:unnamed protein product [Thlaspi arvense]|uniref:Uncharacterized protein n=1 Tax=Thlaspi arvense TaxID=13288 RepID=A0AAU9T7W0_THLAR|nr:unnamed protein product [Thlaspi arvense]
MSTRSWKADDKKRIKIGDEKSLNPLRFSAEDGRRCFVSGGNSGGVKGGPLERQCAAFSGNSEEDEEKSKQQEMDWKMDEEFKRFMGIPSIEADED